MRNRNTGRRRPVRKKSYTFPIVIILVVLALCASGVYIAKTTAQKIAERERQEKIRKERLLAIEREKKKPIIGARKDVAKKIGVNGVDIWNRIDNNNYANDGKKVVFLTFDDGPSTTVTPQVLDVLKKEQVPATFFIKGDSLKIEGADKILKREYDEGHAIGNHTYTHDYKHLYPGRSLNLDNFVNEINQNEQEIKKVLGPKFKINAVRCPGGFMSWKNMDPLRSYLNERKMSSIDWNALSGDAEGKKKTPDELYNMAISTSQGKDIVVLLMHDTYGKENTAITLERIIKYFKDNGYEFKIIV